MRLFRSRLVLSASLALAWMLWAGEAKAQGWDYGRNSFGFAEYVPGAGWGNYYHPGDGVSSGWTVFGAPSRWVARRSPSGGPYQGRVWGQVTTAPWPTPSWPGGRLFGRRRP
jgi:hypothetical protein